MERDAVDDAEDDGREAVVFGLGAAHDGAEGGGVGGGGAAAEGEGEEFFGEGAGKEFGAEEESPFEAGDAIKFTAVGEAAAGVDFLVVFLGAPTADGVEVFEREADGVHHIVTTGAGGIFAVFGEALADGERGGDDVVVEGRDVRGRRRRR